MPIYPYLCSACGHEFETLQKVSDEPLKYCPQCGELTLKKKLTAAAFQLKGTGWYQTDFKDKGVKKDGKEAKDVDKAEAPKDKESKTSADKSETKPSGAASDSTAKSSSGKSESSTSG